MGKLITTRGIPQLDRVKEWRYFAPPLLRSLKKTPKVFNFLFLCLSNKSGLSVYYQFRIGLDCWHVSMHFGQTYPAQKIIDLISSYLCFSNVWMLVHGIFLSVCAYQPTCLSTCYTCIFHLSREPLITFFLNHSGV